MNDNTISFPKKYLGIYLCISQIIRIIDVIYFIIEDIISERSIDYSFQGIFGLILLLFLGIYLIKPFAPAHETKITSVTLFLVSCCNFDCFKSTIRNTKSYFYDFDEINIHIIFGTIIKILFLISLVLLFISPIFLFFKKTKHISNSLYIFPMFYYLFLSIISFGGYNDFFEISVIMAIYTFSMRKKKKKAKRTTKEIVDFKLLLKFVESEYSNGNITEEEYNAKRMEILNII